MIGSPHPPPGCRTETGDLQRVLSRLQAGFFQTIQGGPMNCPPGQREIEMAQSHPLVKEAVIALPEFSMVIPKSAPRAPSAG